MSVPQELLSSQFGKMSSGVAELNYDDNGFEVKVDVKAFSLDELNVKIEEKSLMVYGEHKVEYDGSRCFHQKFKSSYALPEDLSNTDVRATLNDQGVLTIRGTKSATGIPMPSTRDVFIFRE